MPGVFTNHRIGLRRFAPSYIKVCVGLRRFASRFVSSLEGCLVCVQTIEVFAKNQRYVASLFWFALVCVKVCVDPGRVPGVCANQGSVCKKPDVCSLPFSGLRWFASRFASTLEKCLVSAQTIELVCVGLHHHTSRFASVCVGLRQGLRRP